MIAAASIPLDRARRLARTASGMALAALIVVLIVTVIRDIALPILLNVREMMQPGQAGVAAVLRTVLSGFANALPNLLLVSALTQLRVVLGEYAAGRFFTAAAARGVRKTGEALLWALAVKVAVTPTLMFYIAGEPLGLDLATFDLGLAAIALFVLLMGRVLEAAAAIKADSDQIV